LWTLRQDYNRFCVFSEAPYGNKSQDIIAADQETTVDNFDETGKSDELETASACSTINLPDDRWKHGPQQVSTSKEGNEPCIPVDIGINRKTWEILSSAPFMKRLLSQHICAVEVNFTPSPGSQNDSRANASSVPNCYKSFGLLLDNNKKPVLPGETFLARDVFDDTGLSNMPRKHQTWNANSDLVSDIILWEDYRNDPTLKWWRGFVRRRIGTNWLCK
jgi:hypothetical protein